ncbi:T9SS type A sorting domain-containing protein, partial [Dysgonomonas sp. OttesenSCG-928-D17]|nr:T9SS type A sorting domain-containing protein [Dysgonomonas sp. OttesenSCG-928-D17]
MKKIIFIAILSMSVLLIRAQSKISFNYDSSGNRTERVIVLTKSAVTTQELITENVNEQYELKIYPNPTKGQIKLEISNSDKIKSCTITINAMSNGKLVLRKKATLPVTDIDISNQLNGFYIMVIEIDGNYSS